MNLQWSSYLISLTVGTTCNAPLHCLEGRFLDVEKSWNEPWSRGVLRLWVYSIGKGCSRPELLPQAAATALDFISWLSLKDSQWWEQYNLFWQLDLQIQKASKYMYQTNQQNLFLDLDFSQCALPQNKQPWCRRYYKPQPNQIKVQKPHWTSSAFYL